MAQRLMSTNDFCARLKKQRNTSEAKGQILILPRTGTVVVPFQHTGYGWTAVVVGSADGNTPEGHNLWIGDIEIETALQLHTHDEVVAGAAEMMRADPPVQD